MKKLLILAAIIVAGVAANAASFKWSGSGIYASDLTNLIADGTVVSLHAYNDSLSDTIVNTTTTSDGKFTAANTVFSSDVLVGGQTYNFYFTVEDKNGAIYTSQTIAKGAQATSTVLIGFGSQTNSKNASNWSAVPEPTSGLLMLLGLAGLALKRKRA